jgi:UDP-arabinose 4-epimerase
MKVLVTGGAGYIGSHTCKALASQGITPVTIDNMVYGHEWAVKWGPFYKVDIQDTEKVADILRKEKVEAVLHFAAYAYVGESHENPLKYYQNNVVGSMSLFEAMRKADVPKLVFSSTCATYGIPKEVPISESADQNPINPYGSTKLMVERILKDYIKPYRFSAVALRYFNASGADPEMEIGEDHSPETHLIPLTLDAAFGKRESLTVFGTDYPTPDGTCIRDYIHVNDLADAHIRALQRLNEPRFEAYNLGTGSGSSVKEVISAVEKVTGKKVPVQYGTRRPGDPPALVASGDLARQTLGWNPKSSNLEFIVQTASQWHQKHFRK